MEIGHNEVGNVPYSGIHIGWGWIGAAGSTRQNRIVHNDVYNTMQVIWDGMSIYTLGKTRNTVDSPSVIADNYVRGGVYNDEGSDRYLIRDNVLINGGGNFIQWFGNTPDNRADSNFVQLDKLANIGPGNVITNTFVLSNQYAQMPAKAQRIVDSAGPQPLSGGVAGIQAMAIGADPAGPFEVRVYGLAGRLAASFATPHLPSDRQLVELAEFASTGFYRAVCIQSGRTAMVRPLLKAPRP